MSPRAAGQPDEPSFADGAEAQPQRSGAARREGSWLALSLAGVAVLLHLEVLIGGKSFALRDHLTTTLPVRKVLHDALWSGRFPEWWDAVGFGTAFAANPVHQALAPLTWICAALPMPLGADVEQLVYLAVGGIGTALLARRLGAGVAGAFLAGAALETSGYLASLLPNGNLPHVCWSPWVAWAADRLASSLEEAGWRGRARACAALAMFGALNLAGPEPAALVTSAVLALAVALTRRPRLDTIAWLAAGGAGAVAIGAVCLAPALALAAGSERGGGYDLEIAGLWSMHPLRALGWVWPRFLGDPIFPRQDLAWLLVRTGDSGQEPSWATSLYLGAPILLLGAMGSTRRTRWLLGVAAFFLVLALGPSTPLFAAFRAVVPPERYARYPEKHVLGAVVLCCALAGVGFDRVRARVSRSATRVFGAASLAFVLALLAFAASRERLASALLARAAGSRLPFPIEVEGALQVAMRNGALGAGALGLAFAGVVLIRSGRRVRMGALLLAVPTLLLSGWEVRQGTLLVSRDVLSRRPAVIAELPPPGDRLYRPPGAAFDGRGGAELAVLNLDTAAVNVATLHGVRVLPGGNSGQSAAARAMWDGPAREMPFVDLAALAGIRWALLDVFFTPPPVPGRAIARSGSFILSDLSPVRPRAFVAPGWIWVRDEDEALASWLAPGRAEHASAVVLSGEGAPPQAPPGLPAFPCELASPLPERVDLLCSTPVPGYAVLLDEAAPGWEAEVDGAPMPIVRADFLFRAVPIAQGSHHVTFRYRTPGLRAGAIASALAMMALGLLLWRTRARE